MLKAGSCLSIAALLLHVSVVCVAANTGLSQEKLQAIGPAIQRYVDNGDIPGAVVLVARNGEVALLEARGRVDSATQLKQDTVFWVASMTKPVVSVAVLMQMEEGKLALGDPVSKYIPEFATRAQVRVLRAGSPAPSTDPTAPKAQYDLVPASRAITIEDLLTHTSGLQIIGVGNVAIVPLKAGDTLATWVPGLARAPLEFQPGTKWGYSNATGFEVLARIVELTSGLRFDQFLQRRIFIPLRMNSTSLGPRRDLASRNMPIETRFATNPCINGETFHCGSAGLWTSAEDYARFATMLLNGGELDGKRLLSSSSVAALASNRTGKLFPGSSGIPAGAVGFGLGVAVVHSASAELALPTGSYGWDGVGSRRFWVVPRERMVIVMLIPSGKAAPVQREIERRALSAITN